MNLMGKRSPLSKGWALAEAWRDQTFGRARSYLHDQNVCIFMSILVQQNAVLQYIARDQAKLGSPFCGIQLVQVNHLLLVSCCSQEQLQRSHCHCLGEWTVNGLSCKKKFFIYIYIYILFPGQSLKLVWRCVCACYFSCCLMLCSVTCLW